LRRVYLRLGAAASDGYRHDRAQTKKEPRKNTRTNDDPGMVTFRSVSLLLFVYINKRSRELCFCSAIEYIKEGEEEDDPLTDARAHLFSSQDQNSIAKGIV